MTEFESILAIALAFLVVTVSPGPANIAVATVSMSAGRSSGLKFGLGLSLGLAFWGVVAATGLGALLQTTTTALFTLKVFGGAYLLWLAFQSAKSAKDNSDSFEPAPTGSRWFWRGLVLNLSNPKAVVAWMAALSMGLGAEQGNAVFLMATGVCVAIGFMNYAGHALAFSFDSVMGGYRRARRWIDTIVAGLFALAGLSLIRSALTR
jgi:threonine/homoserine/homoserine lactone efflux protein